MSVVTQLESLLSPSSRSKQRRRARCRVRNAAFVACERLEVRRLFATFTGIVWNDKNGNRVQDADEHRLPDIVVELIYVEDDPATNTGITYTEDTTTNSDGVWTFTAPDDANCHQVTVIEPNGWQATVGGAFTQSGDPYLRPTGNDTGINGPDVPRDTGDCKCDCKDCLKVSEYPVRYGDGQVVESATDLSSAGFGTPWGHTRDWTNTPGYDQNNRNGNGWVVEQWPSLVQSDDGNSVAALQSGSVAQWFDGDGSGGYVARHGSLDTMASDSTTGEYVFTGSDGTQTRYEGFDSSLPQYERGSFQSYRDPAGNTISVYSRDAAGDITEVRRTVTSGATTTIESYLYTYSTSGPSAGVLQNVALRRSTDGGTSWSVVRQCAYTYYQGTYAGDDAYGNAGDLRTATVEDGAGTAIGTTYYRYYTLGDSDTTGFVGALKYVVEPDAYARLAAALPSGTTPLTAANAQLSPYATRHYEYDDQQRVTREDVAGAGTNLGTGTGIGTITYAYTSSNNGTDLNNWSTRTVETLADGNQNIVYTNYLTDTLLKSYKDTATGQEWPTYYHYNQFAEVDETAGPSAFRPDGAGRLYDDGNADLIDGGAYLSPNSGQITTSSYFTGTTTATAAAGDVYGKLKDVYVQQGTAGAPVPVSETQYYLQTYTPSGGGAVSSTTTPVASQTVYRNPDGTGGETTSYSYTWLLDADNNPTNRPRSVTTTAPAVGGGENGPGTPDVSTDVLDPFGNGVHPAEA